MIDIDTRERVNRYLINHTEFLKVKDTMTEDQLRKFVDQAISDFCWEKKIPLSIEQRSALIRELVSAVMSLGPLRPLMEDESITEVMINGYNKIYIQRHGHIELTNVKFQSNQQLMHTVQKIIETSGSNKRVDESSPYVDFSLPDGSRVNVILPPVSVVGPVVTIRKFKADIQTVDDLLKLKMFSPEIATLLILGMQAKLNIIFCGATGSGKTTALNVFSRHIPEGERIITIEDTAELRLLQEHVVPLVSKTSNIEGKGEISIRDLFINSLRMRPDRIIVGEIRGGEILDLIQSITSGHSGSLAIIHAESPEDCYSRMVTMMLMTGIRLTNEEIQRQVAKAIDVIVHVELYPDGKRRFSSVTDVSWDEKNSRAVLRNIFHFKQHDASVSGGIIGDWEMDHRRPEFDFKFKKRFVELPDGFFKA